MKRYLTSKKQTWLATSAVSALALFISVGAHAEIYKWTDAKGVTHYSANKPTQRKVKSENIEDKIRFAAGKHKAVATKKNASSGSEKQRSANSKNNKEEVKLDGPDAKLVSYCKKQRSNLEQLKKSFRNVWQDADGKKTRLNQEQRKDKVEFLQHQITEDCSEV